MPNEPAATPAPNPEEIQAAIDSANGNEPAERNESDVTADLWGDIAQDLMSDDDSQIEEVSEVVETPTAEPVTEPAPVVEESAPAPQPAAEPTAEPSAEPEVVATPQPEAPVQEPPATEPSQPAETPEEFKKRQQEIRAKAIEELEKSYSLNEDEAATFLTDPGKVVPKFRAELFMDVFDAISKHVVQAIPQLIEQHNQQQKATNEAEDAFYKANPLLDKAKHAETVNRYANAYIQAVPNASAEQMIKEVGVQVMFALGIDPTQAAAPAAPETPAEPAAPAPYTPAGVNSQAPAPTPAQPDNIWGQVAEDLLDDD